MHKKNMLKELVLNDLDSRVREITTETVRQEQMSVSKRLTAPSAGIPLAIRQAEERKAELARLPAGNVSDIKKRWGAIAVAAAAAAPAGAGTEDVTIQVNSADTIVGISGEPIADAATAVPDWSVGAAAPKNEIVQEESKL
jgi:hypothetical protein